MDQQRVSVNLAEALRYMGYQGNGDQDTMQQVQKMAERVERLSTPRLIQRRFSLKLSENGIEVVGTQLCLTGHSVGQLLKDCKEAVLFCATLGNAIETRLRTMQLRDMGLAMMMDACASSAIESICEQVEHTLQQDVYDQERKYLTDRFSPGYGDLPISVQDTFCNVLDTARQIGVCVNTSGILIPRKSVTAIIGIAEQPQTHRAQKCDSCSKRQDCLFRREGKSCDL